MGLDYPLDLIIPGPQRMPLKGRLPSSSTANPFLIKEASANGRPPPPTKALLDFPALPKNVRHKIVAELANISSRRHLPKYASVSREWQPIIERFTFSELYLTDGRLVDLEYILIPRRQGYIRHVMCHVMLGLYASSDHRETTSQHKESTRVLNDYMLHLFRTMSTWKAEDAGPAGVQLKIVINSPSDESTSFVYGDHRQNRRARAALARISVPSESLPVVSVISGLACSGRHLELASVTLLVTKLPNLLNLEVEMEHDTRDPRDVEQRAAFISSLAYYAPNVTNLRLHRPINHVESTKSPSPEQRALFHTRLRNFTQRCTTVSFDDCVFAREFLAPFANDLHEQRQATSVSNSGAVTTTSLAGAMSGSNFRSQVGDLSWPNLKKLHIRNSYMLRRPYTRVSTRSAALMLIHEVLLLAGRAIGYMPALEELRIRQYVLASERLETIVAEYHAGGRGPTGKKIAPRLLIKGIRPSVPTIDAWRESVRARKGTHLAIEVDTDASY